MNDLFRREAAEYSDVLWLGKRTLKLFHITKIPVTLNNIINTIFNNLLL